MDAAQYYDQYTLLVQSRSPKEIQASAMQFLEEAIKDQKICDTVTNAKILQYDALIATPKNQVKGRRISDEVCKKLLVGFVVAKGNYTKDTYWLYEESSKLFVSFPMLITAGKHGTVQWALLKEISDLAQRKDTNIVKFLTRGNISVVEAKKKYAFAKGCNILLEKASRSDYEAAKADLDLIISCMKDNQGVTKTDFTKVRGNLQFFEAII
jgi:hypothetical protein